ncbi:MAG: hypothetical protein WBG01_09525 [Bacteroidota bacterium]
MPKLTLLCALTVLVSGTLFAGVMKESKSSVTFRGFGKLVTEETIYISGPMKRSDSEGEFDGEGIVGGFVGDLFMEEGNTGEIVDLKKLELTRINHEDEEYTVAPIKKLDFSGLTKSDQSTDREQEEKKSSVREIRSIFRITPTGERKRINDFNAEKYTLLMLREWENTTDGTRGIDSLFTTIWTTQLSAQQEKAIQEEQSFHLEYMKALGMETSPLFNDVMGTSWMAMFSQMKKESRDASAEDKRRFDQFTKEAEKLKGYPVLIDGSYFQIDPNAKKEEKKEEEAPDVTSVGGLFGSITKEITKSDAPVGPQPAFSYYTEILGLEFQTVDTDRFVAPVDYERKTE